MPPTTTDAELSLINDAEFLDELEQFAAGDERMVAAVPQERGAYDDAFDALEDGLPSDTFAAADLASPHEFIPVDHRYSGELSAATEAASFADTRVPFLAVALVLVACLTAGVATAAVVFHDRLARVTATR